MNFDDEVVETSDLEELAELEAIRRTQSPPPLTVHNLNTDASSGSPPRKRIKLYHESNNDDMSKLSVSPAKSLYLNISTPTRFKSSSTMLGATSPAQFVISRSSTQTPGSMDSTSLIKLGNDGPMPTPSFPTSFETYSQDQDLLLFESPARPAFSLSQNATEVDTIDPFKESSENERTTTPVNSPPGPQVRSPSVDPLHLFGTSPLQSLSLNSPSGVTADLPSEDFGKDGFDKLLMFTPVKNLSQRTASLPLTPVGPKSPTQSSPTNNTSESRQNSPSQSLHRSPSADQQRSRSPSPTVDSAAQHEIDLRLAQTVHEQAQGGRYPKRARNPAQLNPYTVDRMRYKLTLKNNPDAIINDKLLDRHRHRHPDDHYEEEEGTQQEGYTFEGDEENEEGRRWGEQQRKRAHREEKRRRIEQVRRGTSGQGQEPVQYPGILQEDLSTTDEDVEKEMKILSKEGRRLLKEQEKQRKAQEKEERRRRREEELLRAKRFPNPDRTFAPPTKSSSLERRPRQPSVDGENGDDEVMILEDGPHTKTVPPRPEQSSSRRQEMLHDYFADDDEFELYDQGDPIQQPVDATPRQNPLSSSPNGSLGNTHETAIEVEEDEEEVEPEPQSQESDAKNPSSKPNFVRNLPSKHAQALLRMLPMAMIKRMYGDSANSSTAKKKRQRVSGEAGDEAESGPLLPGKTRVRHTGKLKDNKDIKGDSESEIDIGSSSDSSSSSELSGLLSEAEDSDVDDILTAYGRQPKKKFFEPKIFDVDDHDNNRTDDEDEIQFISFRKAEKRGATSRRRDPSMIDYMLARPSAFGATRKSSESRRRRRSAGFEFDIMTTGAKRYGREQQMLLSFDNHQKSKNPGTRRKPDPKAKTFKSKGPTSGVDEIHILDDNMSDGLARARKRSPRRKEKKKWRREAAMKGRLWTKYSENRRIESGRVNKTAYASILQNEDFHRALAPSLSPASARSSVRSQKPSAPLVAPGSSSKSQDSDTSSLLTVKDTSRERWVDVPTDFKIDPLLPGTSFAISTYIRKGWLYELINVVFSNKELTQPCSATLFGFKLEPTMGAEKLSLMFPRICGSFCNFATGLPSPDDEASSLQWSTMSHLLSQSISWCLDNGVEQDVHALRDIVKSEVAQLVQQVRELSVTSVQTPLLTFCWFVVELSVKIGPKPVPLSVEGRPEGLFKDATTLLMRLLLQYGIDRAMQPFGHDAPSMDFSSAHFVAELWVRLIHLLSHCSSVEETSMRKGHPFWLVLMDALDLHIQSIDAATSSFETSELIWRTIYSMCALSQFSVHGMAIGQTHLPACWDIVAFGLKSIRLTQMPPENYQTPKGAALRRDIDRYVALVVNRCFLLRERWHWKLTDATPMFNQLLEIFRSRKFANLLHEKHDYPKFLKEGNWELIEVYDHRDTAYTMFLKLVFQAIQEDKLYAEGKPSPKVRKLLSMAVPMSALPFSKTNPPRDEDLPMVYNRISALAVAGDTEKGDCKTQIDTARRYISFLDADEKSRIAILNGMTSWATLMVSRGRSLKAIGEWILDLAKVIKAEFGAASQEDNKSPSPDLHFTKFSVDALLCRVRNIILSHMQNKDYPDPVLFLSLEPVLRSREIVCSEDLQEFGHFASALFDARAKALPPPPRPFPAPLLPTIDEDSQDYGDMDLDLDNVDWSATNIPEALVVPADVGAACEAETNDVKDSKLRSSFAVVDFKWRIYHFVKKYINPPPPGADIIEHRSECDFWIRLWLCCACVERPPENWSRYFTLLQELVDHCTDENKCTDERWVRRVNLSIMFQALKLEPMLYLAKMDDAFEAFLHALASDNNTNVEGLPRKGTLERDYVAFMLSIDCLQHPLFSDVERLLPARNQESGDYEIPPEEFLALRTPLLGAIFKNLNNLLRKQLEGHRGVNLDVEKYVKFCYNMFSAMRYSLSKYNKSSVKYLADNDFCHQAVHALKQNPELCNQQTLEFFAHTWSNDLIPPRANVL